MRNEFQYQHVEICLELIQFVMLALPTMNARIYILAHVMLMFAYIL